MNTKIQSDINIYKWVRQATLGEIRDKISDLRDRREAAGIKQGEVAERLSVFQSNISTLENGRGILSVKYAAKYITIMQNLLNIN